MREKPDILLFMSDQHSACQMSHAGGIADTPNMDELARSGVNFTDTYTSCPICVPARMSFLSGTLPSKTGILTNNDTLPDTIPTFLHTLCSEGYETVLIGRMHFIGENQYHGFTRHLAGDMTPTTWTRPVERIAQERGVMRMGYAYMGALNVMGAGESPVLHYDDHVIRTALEYLSEPHDKPQFILVGTFGPHFPYVAPPELYWKYKAKIQKLEPPEQFNESKPYIENNIFLKDRQMGADEEEALQARAAYCALVERTDSQMGEVKKAFKDYTEQMGHSYIFGYTSDHGDMNGMLGMYGKETFFDPSVRIPFMLEGEEIPTGKCIGRPVSIMDIGATLCGFAGTTFEAPDGVSLVPLIRNEPFENRLVYSQIWEHLNFIKYPDDSRNTYGVMVIKDNYKFITYDGCGTDMLFDRKADPYERENLAEKMPELANELKAEALACADPCEVAKIQAVKKRNAALFSKCEQASGRMEALDNKYRWHGNPPSAREMPAAK
ncbi:sulfatase-like hydrolase/transferase [Clostridium sp. MCC353]|uniref:sulfatase-like hydrolase/transferase n=1 Tax=Clostridium sp. MCC353 TaxID=2592646 RepID=UPI001C00E40A|nr:sulfatase-like hydrolase/transferase [Clostridium sp. MCC353]MBT9778727.1 sulfatase-like hydrolase/transferase [Clostridium sp. MCC353]